MNQSLEKRVESLECIVQAMLIANRGIVHLEDTDTNAFVQQSMKYVEHRTARAIDAKHREKEKYELEEQLRQIQERLQDYA